MSKVFISLLSAYILVRYLGSVIDVGENLTVYCNSNEQFNRKNCVTCPVNAVCMEGKLHCSSDYI